MKRLIPFIAVIIIILSTTAIASADNERGWGGGMGKGPRGEMMGSTSTSTMMNGKGHMGEFKQNLQEKREEFKTKFDDFRKEKIGGMIGMMKQRFTAAIDRLGNIADRIETRIGKIEADKHITLTDARAKLADARKHLHDAENALDDVSTSTVALFTDATSTGQKFGHVHDLFKTAKEAIMAARQSLHDALQATGQAHGSDDEHATSTDH